MARKGKLELTETESLAMRINVRLAKLEMQMLVLASKRVGDGEVQRRRRMLLTSGG